MDALGFQGRNVLVTGGGSGLGQAIAIACAGRGATVGLLDIDADGMAATVEQLPEAARATARVRRVDVSDEAAAREAVDQLANELGGVDALAACAGVSIKEPFAETTREAWDRTLRINVLGTAACCTAAAEVMRRQERPGALLTMASTAAIGYVWGLGAHYHASKGAIAALTRYMAVELAPFQIRVNSLAPGLARTPLSAKLRANSTEEALVARVPLRKIVEPEEVGEAAAFLLSDAASSITGQVISIDGGLTAVTSAPPQTQEVRT
jgi:NAD(P)-dependent dehydrogenase (short-subunit alcohol dehydrogenase family)